MKIYQQGDILLKSTDNLKGLKLNTDLLYKGEQNHHRIRGNFNIYKNDEETYLESNECELFHEEHRSIKIPKGIYRLDIVLEYDHVLEESRRVID